MKFSDIKYAGGTTWVVFDNEKRIGLAKGQSFDEAKADWLNSLRMREEYKKKKGYFSHKE